MRVVAALLLFGPLGPLGALSLAACSGCGRSSGAPNNGSGAPSAAYVNRTSVAPEAGPAAVRDVAMWTIARDGTVEDLASLAVHEGAAGLVEAAAEDELRPTALRAMGYAAGWAQLPYLADVANAKNDDEAKLALDAAAMLASRRRRSEDVEDVDELRAGCEKLGVLARDVERPRDRRIVAIRALRMMPCAGAPGEGGGGRGRGSDAGTTPDLPTDLDAR